MSALRMPAEWEPHEATWLAWPHQASDWDGEIGPVHRTYGEIVEALSHFERVEVVCRDEAQRRLAAEELSKRQANAANVRLHLFPTDRSWLRDSAPTAVRAADDTLQWACWQFNAWAKYDNYQLDSELPSFVSQVSQLPAVVPLRPESTQRLVLEGGAIETDGRGTLIVTEECLLSDIQQRNPGMGKKEYEQAFAEYLGIEQTIWLERGIAGDDTHGHIDDLARFVAPGKVVVVTEDNEKDENYQPLKDAVKRLEKAKDAQGNALEVFKLPSPSEIWAGDLRLPASYANFYIANDAVLVPVFDDPKDREALAILGALFPDHTVFGINCRHLVIGQGTIHCLTQQQPVR